MLNMLSTATNGGFVFGSAAHAELLTRMDELATITDGFTTKVGTGIKELLGSHALEGIGGYTPPTQQTVMLSHAGLTRMGAAFEAAAAATPEPMTALAMWSWNTYSFVHSGRHHALPEFALPDRHRMRKTIDQYVFEKSSPAAKAVVLTIDMFMFDVEPHALLLFYGDLVGARLGWVKVVDAHKKALAKVQQGQATGEIYSFEAVCAVYFLIPALLYAGETATLREFMANSLTGAALHDEGIREGIKSWFQGAFAGWRTDDGYSLSTYDTWMLLVRAVAAQLEANTEANRAALREWLPPPDDLLHIAEFECGWRGHTLSGVMMPLLLAKLHGERLGDWAAATRVAEGVLDIEQLNPMLRSEAQRLLARAHAALGDKVEACRAVERAVADAKLGRYIWIEMLATRDLAQLCDAGDVKAAKERLESVKGRMAGSGTAAQLDADCEASF